MYELIAVASQKGIGIWHLGSVPDVDGRLLVEKVANLPGHGGEVKDLQFSSISIVYFCWLHWSCTWIILYL